MDITTFSQAFLATPLLTRLHYSWLPSSLDRAVMYIKRPRRCNISITKSFCFVDADIKEKNVTLFKNSFSRVEIIIRPIPARFSVTLSTFQKVKISKVSNIRVLLDLLIFFSSIIKILAGYYNDLLAKDWLILAFLSYPPY